MTPAHAAARSGGSRRWQPVLVVLLVLALSAAVALVLAQSAGAIHLPFLGGNQAAALLPRT